MPTFGEILGTWIAAGLTLMMFSFIYKDNRFFKFGEHLYLGISIGYFVNVQYWGTLVPDVGREVMIAHNYYVLIPTLLGVFVLLRLVPSLGWLSRMSFALYIGGAAGIAIPYVINGVLLPQLRQTLAPFQSAWWLSLLTLLVILGIAFLIARAVEKRELLSALAAALLSAGVIVLGARGIFSGPTINLVIILLAVFSTLIFFFFSLEHKKAVGQVSRIGLLFIMISFGASFGYTVMARISLLIGRFQFLLDDWIRGTILRG